MNWRLDHQSIKFIIETTQFHKLKKKHEWDIDRFFDQITFTFSTVVGIERHDSENIVELNIQLNAIKYYVS